MEQENRRCGRRIEALQRLAGEPQAANGARMGANRGDEGRASPVVKLGEPRGLEGRGSPQSSTGSDSTRGTESTENGIEKMANAWFNSVLTRRRKGAKNCMGWMVTNSREAPLVVSPPLRRSVQTEILIRHAS